MVDGFRERAKRVNELLCATRDHVPGRLRARRGSRSTEAVYFHRKLVEAELPFGGVIVNKVHYEGLLGEGGAEGSRPSSPTRSTTPTSPAGSPRTSATTRRSPPATGATSPTSPRSCERRR